MAMNFAPLDCPCQGASSESKKIYLDFFILENIAKNQKIHIFGSHSKPSTIIDSNLVRIGDKKFFEKNHVPPPSI
jgi:hypothetical protein